MSDAGRRTLGSMLKAATSPKCTSQPVIVATAVVSVLWHLLASVDLPAQNLAVRIAAAAISTFPLFALLAAGNMALGDSSRHRTEWMLALLGIGGALRGYTLAALLAASGLHPKFGAGYRTETSVIIFSVTVAIFTYAWTTYTDHRDAARELVEETGRLEQALAQLEIESRAEDMRRVSEVAADIARELERVDLHPAGRQREELQALIDDRVRPLSRAMAADMQAWMPASRLSVDPRTTATWHDADWLAHLPSPLLASSVSLMPLPTVLQLFGAAVAVQMVLIGAVGTYLVAAVTFPVARRALAGATWRRVAVGVTASFSLLAVLGIASAAALSQPLTGSGALTRPYVPAIIGFPVYGWLVTAGSALLAQAKDRRAGLMTVRDDLRWTIARINLMAWFHRGVVTRLLHGPIQNAMHATVIRLRDASPESVVDGVIADLKERITQNNRLARGELDGPVSVEEEIADIAALWGGIADVTVSAGPDAVRALDMDPAVTAIVLDMCEETCSNAIRHSGATAVRIDITAGQRTIALDATDNGRARTVDAAWGVGTTMLRACSIESSIVDAGGSACLHVLLPRAAGPAPLV